MFISINARLHTSPAPRGLAVAGDNDHLYSIYLFRIFIEARYLSYTATMIMAMF